MRRLAILNGMFLVGIGCLIIGAWEIHPAVGWIAVGMILSAFSCAGYQHHVPRNDLRDAKVDGKSGNAA